MTKLFIWQVWCDGWIEIEVGFHLQSSLWVKFQTILHTKVLMLVICHDRFYVEHSSGCFAEYSHYSFPENKNETDILEI